MSRMSGFPSTSVPSSAGVICAGGSYWVVIGASSGSRPRARHRRNIPKKDQRRNGQRHVAVDERWPFSRRPSAGARRPDSSRPRPSALRACPVRESSGRCTPSVSIVTADLFGRAVCAAEGRRAHAGHAGRQPHVRRGRLRSAPPTRRRSRSSTARRARRRSAGRSRRDNAA